MSHSLSLITFLSLLFLFLFSSVTATTIGVTYISSPTLPPPEKVVDVLQSLKITAVRLPVADPDIIRAFSYTNISLFLVIPNSLIPSISGNRSAASLWIYKHVIPFYPRAQITAISVGNNVLAEGDVTTADLLLLAIRNVHRSLVDVGIRQITVSTTFSFVNIMTTSFPPSSAEFQEPAGKFVIKPLLQLLTETNSSFFVNLYPYSVYKLRPEIPIGFALFQELAYNFRDDTVTGVRYRNLFDLMVDAVIAAMAVAGHENIPVVVAETGWPCFDPSTEAEARGVYAKMYLQGLVNHLRSGKGTPLRKEGVADVYIYELFDANESVTKNQALRSGGTWQNWGVLFPNMSMKFQINFSNGGSISPAAVYDIVFCFLLLVIGYSNYLR
ncbi:glucan endo-1,3-beta-glucosidase 7-like [Cynara cardunculus var. scolymus]|uniref:Glycoside hydrolase, catalytic domain-containing protein n=1 Tax=Cynara cardunculus var. scolymus TaxID=59895 RepID=A0A103YIR9_CYNCS|nr:glucan endo-1,3-beta-glucosidase 7-like [Cynara cardunculus var. scolymus]KVI09852.1 Glycoside hydrolase, catalytic domain-containing protein [Cynara cardunculus var. scolymus]